VLASGQFGAMQLFRTYCRGIIGRSLGRHGKVTSTSGYMHTFAYRVTTYKCRVGTVHVLMSSILFRVAKHPYHS